MTGGGFGGCTVTLVKKDSVDVVVETLKKGYEAETGRKASFFVCKPAEGAKNIDIASS